MYCSAAGISGLKTFMQLFVCHTFFGVSERAMGNILGPAGEQCLAAAVLHDAYEEAARAAPMLGAQGPPCTPVVSPLLSSLSTSGNPPLS